TAKLTNTPPTSTTSIPPYNINQSSKPVTPPTQQPSKPATPPTQPKQQP
ncbi:unnamed protein product, partial [Rotaria sordida]